MKKYISALSLLLLTGLLVFSARPKDEQIFCKLTNQIFVDEMESNSLNLHYTLVHPEKYHIDSQNILLPSINDSNLSQIQEYQKSLSKLKETNLHKSKYDFILLKKYLTLALELADFKYLDDPITPGSGIHTSLPTLLSEYRVSNMEDAQTYLCLLEKLGDYLQEISLFEKERKARNLLQPYSSLQATIQECDNLSSSKLLETTFENRVRALLDAGHISKDEYISLVEQNKDLLKNQVWPAYMSLADDIFVLSDESVEEKGLGAYPDGKKYYELLLKKITGSYREIPAIKNLLLTSFHQEAQEIINLQNTNADSHSASMSYENFDRCFPLQNPQAMLADLQNRMRADFPALSTPINLEVKAVDASMEDYTAPAFYMIPPIDGYEDNVIYINNKLTTPGLELYTTLAHEGFPGHLYQNVYFSEKAHTEKLNPIRFVMNFGGYMEGWALYTELISYDYASQLFLENGLPEAADYCQIQKHSRNLQLCLYSLIDILINYENVPKSQIINILDSFGIKSPETQASIYSYISREPCNYLKYYLGYLEILELKKQAKLLWQDDFSLMNFHKFILDMGPSDFDSLSMALPPQS